MTDDRKAPEAFSLRRWSQRKLAVAREERSGTANAEGVHDRTPASQAGAPAPGAASAVAAREIDAAAVSARATAAEPTAPTLPAPESLTFESDFTAFMQPGVDENVRRTALRKLLRDPRFNVMDGLDVYIDDYSKPDPIAPEIVRQLAHARYLFDPPKTRVNDQGYVEDVVEPAASPSEDGHATPAQDDHPIGATEVPALDDARIAVPAIEPAPACADGARETQNAREASDDERA
ncbi:MAG TPA: DUF3306 domain-containing protein [Casimicrobiaceae bacterium]|jgi:hypothetical protein|nr:DUF3306 domain-containing protein [Casimicrobiaceae bacterium]HET9748007.1 DUF3306 domain-containing protein [Casimicrobiaceae bacterium]